MHNTMTRSPQTEAPAPRGHASHIRPLAYAAVVLAVFLTTVIVLAVKAGSGAAMLTTLFIVVLAGTACGLWGTAMAVRDTHDHHLSTNHHLDAAVRQDPQLTDTRS